MTPPERAACATPDVILVGGVGLIGAGLIGLGLLALGIRVLRALRGARDRAGR